MSTQVYNVPTIPGDLWQEDTLYQIADTLEHLDKIATDVFSRISQKVANNHSRLQKVNERIGTAQAKVEKLKGSNKATKVFACAKYPSSDYLEEYETMFRSKNGLTDLQRSRHKPERRQLPVDEKVINEKLQYYNVYLNVKNNRKDDSREGLGRLPRTIPSISSLLLFNTSENPYKKYVLLDPLGVVTKTRKAEDEEEGLTEAPSTIAQREELQKQASENFSYVPSIGVVPEIAVPDFLPDLLGVADDLSYSADLGPSIAPSVPGSHIPDLPSMVPEIESIPTGPAGMTDRSTVPPPPEVLPPPPPTPPPPPPPPPPPAPLADQAPVEEKKVKTPPQEVVSPKDNRASLLESIRQAGGIGKAKLRSAKDQKEEIKKKKKEEKNSLGGGDFMSDLFSKLAMRRKGISGTGKASGKETVNGPSTGGGSAMDKISAMIPSPPKPTGETGTDEDWD